MTEETIKYPDGSVYVGEVKDGKRHGRGTCTYSDGIYDGKWKNDMKHGRGKWTYHNEKFQHMNYEGVWKNGRQMYIRNKKTQKWDLTIDGEMDRKEESRGIGGYDTDNAYVERGS